jgi:murein L,D-transpeptidase YafK
MPDDGRMRIVVRKNRRELIVYHGRIMQKTYRVALGFSPFGDKQCEGDGRTPEGSFYICQKNSSSKYYVSLGVSYPSVKDAARGLQDKLITAAEHNAIVDAIENGRIPPWKTKLGGEIFIHGGGASRDWTHGCIALENPDMREIFEAVSLGTELSILP